MHALCKRATRRDAKMRHLSSLGKASPLSRDHFKVMHSRRLATAHCGLSISWGLTLRRFAACSHSIHLLRTIAGPCVPLRQPLNGDQVHGELHRVALPPKRKPALFAHAGTRRASEARSPRLCRRNSCDYLTKGGLCLSLTPNHWPAGTSDMHLLPGDRTGPLGAHE